MALAVANIPRTREQSPDSRESSPSPKTVSPRSQSPQTQRKQQMTNDSIPHAVNTSSPLRVQLTESSPTKQDGFPFYATPSKPTPLPLLNGSAGRIGKDSDPMAPSIAELMQEERTKDMSSSLAPPTSTMDGAASEDSSVQDPPNRRSVQFARSSSDFISPLNNHSRSTSRNIHEDPGGLGKASRGGTLLTRLRQFTGSSSTHARSPSSNTIGADSLPEQDESGTFTPSSNVMVSDSPGGYASEAEYDAEDSGPEEGTSNVQSGKRKRKSRRPDTNGAQTAPTTPRTPFMRDGRPHFFSRGSGSPLASRSHFRPSVPGRRATTTDLEVDENGRLGVSEDEGRQRLHSKRERMRRELRALGSSSGPRRTNTTNEDGDRSTSRPGGFRRAFTGLAGGEAADGAPFSPFKRTGVAGGNSAARWRQLAAQIKAMGQKNKRRTVDQTKSAELLAELTAGVPAALMVASMFQRDQNGKKRLPILLEQLKVRLSDIRMPDGSLQERPTVWKIHLEYGNGSTRQSWDIERTIWDFSRLAWRYGRHEKYQQLMQLRHDPSRKKTKMPKFPKRSFPYARKNLDKLFPDSDSDEEAPKDETTASGNETATDRERPGKKKRRSSMSIMRRKSSVPGQAMQDEEAHATTMARREPYQVRQRLALEKYLQQMIRFHIFSPESYRLCKYLELSALGVRLAVEGDHHGKEGFLYLQAGTGIDLNRSWTTNITSQKTTRKWFLVRHSYIVCTEGLESMDIYDVFLIDQDFRMKTRSKIKIGAADFEEEAKRPRLEELPPPDPKKLGREEKPRHILKLYNSEQKWRLGATREKLIGQFRDSISKTVAMTPWARRHRFDSFAPIRQNVFAQWLVDGRDYMWNVSRAISMAKDVIFIHGWWLSPELYMRRPAAISQKWRLDRLLQRKAQEGVKVFVMMYRNIESAIPIDSEYSKFSLLDLHPNVFVQRSPNQMRQGTFFWAHHEKLCIIDHLIAFCGGLDLCFGRWDTPSHEIADDKLTGFEPAPGIKDSDHCQLWPGKDYSNPRVQDFYALDKPYEEMYDRTKIPRMPWHDIAMQMVGQPARDLARHFIQRWNYVLRQRKPTRPTPMLLPPADFKPNELQALEVTGTCEVQILRSAAKWSLGTLDRIEHSIMNAYCKMIEDSDHFVYIENQFFITSCEVEGTKIENGIGDALVERIIRAHENGEAWRAVIIIPLLPGFQNTVDAQDGTSVRLIMQCQYRSINRGDGSIFGRLRNHNIEPRDYIDFFSLRSWGKIGPRKELTTEQLYIHAKCMIVDDRVAIIGSANINERSMRGNRDSEVAAIVRDMHMIDSTMAGEPYKVGKFAHSLRVRLMKEHIGVDVDEATEGELDGLDAHFETQKDHARETGISSKDFQVAAEEKTKAEIIEKAEDLHSFNHDADWLQAGNHNLKVSKKETHDPRVTKNVEHRQDVCGEGADKMIQNQQRQAGRTDSKTTSNLGSTIHSPDSTQPDGSDTILSPQSPRSTSETRENEAAATTLPPPPYETPRMDTTDLGLPLLATLPALPSTDDTDIGGPSLYRKFSEKTETLLDTVMPGMKHPVVDKHALKDPLNDFFYQDVWYGIAEKNTAIFRTVFRCNPDSTVESWREYKEYETYKERFSEAQGPGKTIERAQREAPKSSGPPGQTTAVDRIRLMAPAIEGAKQIKQKKSNRNLFLRARKGSIVQPNEDEFAEKFNKSSAAEDAERAARSKDATGSRPLDEKADIRPLTATTANSIGSKPPTPAISEHPEKSLNSLLTSNDGEKSSMPDLEKGPAPPTRPHANTLSVPLSPDAAGTPTSSNSQRRRRKNTSATKRSFKASDELMDLKDAEELLGMVQGHLVLWPYNWLAKEETGGNWLFSIDQIAPLEIYD